MALVTLILRRIPCEESPLRQLDSPDHGNGELLDQHDFEALLARVYDEASRAYSHDGKTMQYTIVGPAEARPTEGMISNESPVGRALLGKRVGDEVQVQVPRGVLRLTVIRIS